MSTDFSTPDFAAKDSAAQGVNDQSAQVAQHGARCLYSALAGLAIQWAHRLMSLVVFLLVIRVALGLMTKPVMPTSQLLPIAGLLADAAVVISLMIAGFAVDEADRKEGRRLTLAGAGFLVGVILWTMVS